MNAEDAKARAFSLRLPEGLYLALKNYKDAEGRSMNQLVGAAIADFLDKPELAPSGGGPEVRADIAADAVGGDPSAVGALKGIAQHLVNTGQVTTACVIYASAARLISALEDPAAGSREYSRTASLAERHQLPDLAISLYRGALTLDSQNLEAAGRLGQLLHHRAQRDPHGIELYREAEVLLRPVAPFDDRAKLFHGWSLLHVARADGQPTEEAVALQEIGVALKAWAFGAHDETERTKWIRQVKNLAHMGADAAVLQGDLVEFSNAHARWRPISDSEVVPEVV